MAFTNVFPEHWSYAAVYRAEDSPDDVRDRIVDVVEGHLEPAEDPACERAERIVNETIADVMSACSKGERLLILDTWGHHADVLSEPIIDPSRGWDDLVAQLADNAISPRVRELLTSRYEARKAADLAQLNALAERWGFKVGTVAASGRRARVSALLAGLETPDDLTPEEQEHHRADLIDLLQDELEWGGGEDEDGEG